MCKATIRIREDIGPSLLHASPAELAMHNREKGDYSCKSLEMGLFYRRILGYVHGFVLRRVVTAVRVTSAADRALLIPFV